MVLRFKTRGGQDTLRQPLLQLHARLDEPHGVSEHTHLRGVRRSSGDLALMKYRAMHVH